MAPEGRSLMVYPRESWKSRLAFISLVCVFVALFTNIYTHDLAPVFGYMRMTYNEPETIPHVLAWVLALVPATFLSLKLEKPSQFILWLLYIGIYIPSTVVPLYMRLRPEWEIIALDAVLLLGLALLALITHRKTKPYAWKETDGRAFWGVLWTVFVGAAIYIVVTFGSNLRLVGLNDVYTSGLRISSRSIFDNSYVGFAVMLMYSTVNPLLLALGLQNRKIVLVAAGVAGQFLCYSTGGLKMIVLSIALVLFVHTVIRRSMRRAAHALMAAFIGLLLTFQFATTVSDRDNGKVLTLETLVMRSLAIPGLLTAEYHDYFSEHPRLHLANTKPFNWILSNPLDQEVIFAITSYYTGNYEATSNAHFWAQDGIANFGLYGVLMISIITGLVLRVVDRISARHDAAFATMVFIFTGLNLSNAPLTTTLWSGGVALTCALMVLVKKQGEPATRRAGKTRSAIPSVAFPGLTALQPALEPEVQ
jgi:hypothetical protein